MNESPDPQSLVHLTGRYLDALRVRHYSERTLRLRHYHLDYFRRWCEQRGLTRASEISKAVVQQYQTHLYHYRKIGIRPSEKDKPLSIQGQKMQLCGLRGLFGWLARNNFILYNPAADIELPRHEPSLPRHVLTESEIERVLAVPDCNEPDGLRDRAILETLYSTAIRRSELLHLKLYELDQERGLLRVTEGKGRKDRLVPIGERAVRWIEKYLVEARPRWLFHSAEQTLFLTVEGLPLSTNRLSQIVRGYVDRSGVGKTGSCHLFRHSCATLLHQNGADIRYIQQLLGHASLETTQIYTRVSIQDLKRVHERCHPAAHLERPPAAASPLLEKPAESAPATTATPTTPAAPGAAKMAFP